MKARVSKLEALKKDGNKEAPCAIVITEAVKTSEQNSIGDGIQEDEETMNRFSILSDTSTITDQPSSNRNSDSNCEKDPNIEYGASVFYVVWD